MSKLLKELLPILKGKEIDYTTVKLNKAIWLLAIPMVLEMLMEGLFSVVDAYFVGKVSNAAVTTVGLTETIATIIYSVGIGIGIAATAVVSRRIGEKKPEEASIAAFQAIFVSVLVAAVISIIGVIFASDILRLMGADEEVVETGSGFTRILLGTNIVIVLLFVLNGIFRGVGDALIAMLALWVANILNIILDPIFIFGWGPVPEMGVTGAAIATTIGRSCGVAFQLYILFKGGRLIRLSRRHVKVVWEIVRRITNVAATGAGQFLIASMSWVFLARIMAEFGTDVYAGYTFAIRIVIFTILPSWGIANAAATLVGQNLGAKNPERAEDAVWKTVYINMGLLFGVSLLLYLKAPELIGIFTQHPVTADIGIRSLQIVSLGYVFFAVGMVFGQAFGGAGDTRTPTLLNFISFWLLEIPLAWVLANHMQMGPDGVCWAIVISETLLAVLFIIFFRRGKWKLTQV